MTEDFILVKDIAVHKDVLTRYFKCDYEKCQGACCWGTVDGYVLEGGLLTPEEASELLKKASDIVPYCEEQCKSVAFRRPVHVGMQQFYTSQCNDVCVYCNREEHTCALKLAHSEGKVNFAIPVNCELYPLSLEFNRSLGKTSLILENLFDKYCEPAYELGEKERVKVYEFCRIPIIRLFGESFYAELDSKAKSL